MALSGRDYVREKMPTIGFGTYQIRSERVLNDVIDTAISCGYRFFDTAQIYGNEAILGRIFKKVLPKYGLERSDIFITSKISPANQGTELARKSVRKSLENLQTDYIDLMLIHWPGTSRRSVVDPRNAEYRQQTYEILEEFHRSGELRAIGVSNYEIRHLEQLLARCCIHPAVNQVEFHPHFHQVDLLEFCQSRNIHFQDLLDLLLDMSGKFANLLCSTIVAINPLPQHSYAPRGSVALSRMYVT
ncbi:glyoxal reductase domain protein [Dictyocaulus viviparus]|uniref:Glyoxal reductase domain protein n=1 Tax=Dictyocaulus viviparus TaxID=29172 RepID=A0A0D8XQM8_DICVI|nr:glyoxal reductase domain protein [Dictyocaulus viviparus]